MTFPFHSMPSRGFPNASLRWKMDEGSGTSLTDASGNGHTGTLGSTVTWSTVGGGTALQFDGAIPTSFISASFSLVANQAVSISAWLYCTQTAPSYVCVFDSSLYAPMLWFSSTQQIEFDAGRYTTPTIYRNLYTHVAMTHDVNSGVASYYVNGALAGVSSSAYSVPSQAMTFFNRSTSSCFIGKARDLAIFPTKLTADQVLAIYNAGAGA